MHIFIWTKIKKMSTCINAIIKQLEYLFFERYQKEGSQKILIL